MLQLRMLSHTSFEVGLFLNKPTPVSLSEKNMSELEEKFVKETNKTGVKPNTFMKRRMGMTGRNQLASSKFPYFSLILVGLLLIGCPVLAENQDGRDLQSGNSSRNELFSDTCMMRPPQRPEPEEFPANFKKAKEERIRKLQLELGYCMIEASKDHPYVAVLIVILVCFVVYFCWMFWFDLMVFILMFVIFCDGLSKLFGHQLLSLFFSYLDDLYMEVEHRKNS